MEDDLYDYLHQRAARNFRTAPDEVQAIVFALRAAERAADTSPLPSSELPAVLTGASDAGPEAEPEAPPEPGVTHKLRGPRGTLSGYFGVHRYGKRWIAKLTRNGVATKVGVFDDPEEAAQAYDDAVRTSGTGGRLNFPTEQEEAARSSGGLETLPDWIRVQGPGASDIPPEHLPEALRRGLIASGEMDVPPVEDHYEAPSDEDADLVPDPDIDPDPPSLH